MAREGMTTACIAGAHGERGAGGRVRGLPSGVDRVNPGSQEPPGTDTGSYCRLTRRTGTVSAPHRCQLQFHPLMAPKAARHFISKELSEGEGSLFDSPNVPERKILLF